jgi:short-subunit dehydrogenase
MAKRTLTDCRALITGASSGIGKELALALARRGVDVVLVARRADRLEQVAQEVRAVGRRAEIVVGDITDDNARMRAINAASNAFGGLDILVNNAGVAAHGRFAEASPERVRPIFEVNFFAAVELIRAALPLLRKGKQPIIVNIGSILGERASPHKTEYSASKFALHGFSEALRPELAKDGISVLVVAAGPTETEHFEHLVEDLGELPWGEPQRTPASVVARRIVEGIERDRHKIVPGRRAWWWLLLNRVAPGWVDRILERYG